MYGPAAERYYPGSIGAPFRVLNQAALLEMFGDDNVVAYLRRRLQHVGQDRDMIEMDRADFLDLPE